MKKIAKLYGSFERFFLRPAYATPLAALRIGLSLVLLLQAYMLSRVLPDLYGSDGILQGELARFLSTPGAPQIGWIASALAPLGLNEASTLNLAGGVYILSLLLLLVGFGTRLAALVAWFFHWMFMATGETTSYGMDLYAHVFLFYLIFVPSGGALSLDLILSRKRPTPTSYARLGLRVMQLQLCITYLMSAKDKAAGEQWWNGELVWRALTMPLFQPFDMSWTAQWPVALMVAGWGCLLLEGGYFIFIWPRRTRWIWIAGIVGLHAGIGILMGLQLFGLIMCVLTPAIFGVSPESRRVLAPEWRRRLAAPVSSLAWVGRKLVRVRADSR